MSRAARAHPLEMINSSNGPRCTMCKLVAVDPEYNAIVKDASRAKKGLAVERPARARWRCTKCNTCICSRNPTCYLKHIEGS